MEMVLSVLSGVVVYILQKKVDDISKSKLIKKINLTITIITVFFIGLIIFAIYQCKSQHINFNTKVFIECFIEFLPAAIIFFILNISMLYINDWISVKINTKAYNDRFPDTANLLGKIGGFIFISLLLLVGAIFIKAQVQPQLPYFNEVLGGDKVVSAYYQKGRDKINIGIPVYTQFGFVDNDIEKKSNKVKDILSIDAQSKLLIPRDTKIKLFKNTRIIFLDSHVSWQFLEGNKLINAELVSGETEATLKDDIDVRLSKEAIMKLYDGTLINIISMMFLFLLGTFYGNLVLFMIKSIKLHNSHLIKKLLGKIKYKNLRKC
ncbi:hypothetical protein [Lactococcus garvieae]|uniref:hypothetical protein n=1 Tax=Lactococcus garvieae TaxID=1363 RepID=UPI00398E3C57